MGGWGGDRWGRRRLVLQHQYRQLKVGDRLELENKDLHHLDEQLLAVPVLLLGALSYALDQVKQELARHGLDGGWQTLVVHVFAGELNGAREVGEG